MKKKLVMLLCVSLVASVCVFFTGCQQADSSKDDDSVGEELLDDADDSLNAGEVGDGTEMDDNAVEYDETTLDEYVDGDVIEEDYSEEEYIEEEIIEDEYIEEEIIEEEFIEEEYIEEDAL